MFYLAWDVRNSMSGTRDRNKNSRCRVHSMRAVNLSPAAVGRVTGPTPPLGEGKGVRTFLSFSRLLALGSFVWSCHLPGCAIFTSAHCWPPKKRILSCSRFRVLRSCHCTRELSRTNSRHSVSHMGGSSLAFCKQSTLHRYSLSISSNDTTPQ